MKREIEARTAGTRCFATPDESRARRHFVDAFTASQAALSLTPAVFMALVMLPVLRHSFERLDSIAPEKELFVTTQRQNGADRLLAARASTLFS
ncbi:MAG TPA: hypothetical protein VIF40_11080 [Methylosinus sp.]|uniref:hypothetical protein n=1 Tax=Methylosinus sp. TaxID=427 RepID=UPI002F95C8E6